MPIVLLQLPGGEGVIRQDEGWVVVTHDVSGEHGQRLRDEGDFRPVRAWRDEFRSLVAGRLPPGAVTAEVVDDRGARVTAAAGNGVYVAIIEQPIDGHDAVVCCCDAEGEPVMRPLPGDWIRKRVSDASEPCPACGALDYDEVLPSDGSRGGRGGHGHDGPFEPARVVVCRRCGHEEGSGNVFRYQGPDNETDRQQAARRARIRADARLQKWYSDAMTLRGVSFSIYAAAGWAAASINSSRSRGEDLVQLTVGHCRLETDDPFASAQLTVATGIANRRRGDPTLLERAQTALEAWLDGGGDGPQLPDELSEAATKLWFAARRRDHRAAVLGAEQSDVLITIDDAPEWFLKLGAPGGRWVAVRDHDALAITVAGGGDDPSTLVLEPLADPAARLLGPQPDKAV